MMNPHPPQVQVKRTIARHVVVKPSAPKPVEIFETELFATEADMAFTPIERRALHLVLAENPLAGANGDQVSSFLQLPYLGRTVVYATSPNLEAVFLLMLDKGGAPPGNDEGGGPGKKVKEILAYLVKGGVFATGKRIGDFLIDQITTLSHR